MSSFRNVALLGVRAVALVGILPGALVAAAYFLVLTQRLYQHWDIRTAIVLGMAAWGALGVVGLWHEYVRLTRGGARMQDAPVSPRAVLFLWALLLLAVVVWRADAHPFAAAFLVPVALYSFARAFGWLRYKSRPATARRARVPRAPRRVRVREDERSRGRSPRPRKGRQDKSVTSGGQSFT